MQFSYHYFPNMLQYFVAPLLTAPLVQLRKAIQVVIQEWDNFAEKCFIMNTEGIIWDYLHIRDDELSKDVMRCMAGALQFDTHSFVNLLFIFIWPVLRTFILRKINIQHCFMNLFSSRKYTSLVWLWGSSLKSMFNKAHHAETFNKLNLIIGNYLYISEFSHKQTFK